MTRRLTLLPLLLLALGCTGGGTTPLTPSPEGAYTPAGLGPTLIHGDLAESAWGLYRVTLDPASLTAEAQLLEARAASANDDVVDLEVSRFLRPDSFRFLSVTRGAGTIDLTYEFEHPFAAPTSLTPPGSAANRADLGAAVRVLFLLDSSPGSPIFFPGEGDLRTNTDLIANASGYINPGALVDVPVGVGANLFPYQVLVDETLDNRVGVSNSGDPRGNFDDAPEGWQANNIVNGGANDGWTGMGYIQQGQVARRTVSLDAATLGTTPMTFDVALLAKYGQPKIAKPNKLPANPSDVLIFGYRANHIALDLEALSFHSESGGYLVDAASASTLNFLVRDWDRLATETTFPNLSDEPNAQYVGQGESGAPTLSVSIPDAGITSAAIPTILDDDTGFHPIPDGAPESGIPGDEIVFSAAVPKPGGTGQIPGPTVGLVRATDPEATLDTSGWHSALSPDGSTPVAPALPITYQIFRVVLGGGSGPTATVALTDPTPPSPPAQLLSGTGATVSITAIDDPDGDPVDLLIDWGDGAGFVTVATDLMSPYPDQIPTGPSMNNVDLTPDAIAMTVRLSDGAIDIDYPLSYELGPNRPPQIVGLPGLGLQGSCLASPSTFTLTLTGAVITDPEGDTITYTVIGTPSTGPAVTSSGIAAFPFSGPAAGPWLNPPVTFVDFTGYANDPLHPTTSGTALPTAASPLQGLVGTATPFVQTFGGGVGDLPEDIATDGAGNFYVGGRFGATVDFDPGPGTASRTAVAGTDCFVTKFTALGAFVWVATWGGAGGSQNEDYLLTVAVDTAGNVYGAGRFETVNADFDPGPGVLPKTASGGGLDAFCVKLNSDGTLAWASTWGGPAQDRVSGITVDGLGRPVMAGQFTGTHDIDPGPGVQMINSAGGDDGYVLRLDPATGFYQLVAQISNSVSDSAEEVVTDGSGSLYVAGTYQLTIDLNPGAGVDNRTASFGTNPWIVKLSESDFSYIWGVGVPTNTSGGLTHRGMTVDAAGAVYYAGDFNGTNQDFDPGPGSFPLTSVSTDASLLKLNSAGTFQWAVRLGGISVDVGTDVAVDNTGVYWMGEWFTDTVDFNPGPGVDNRTGVGNWDLFLLKLDVATGNYLWGSAIGSTNRDGSGGVVPGGSCGPVSTGSFQGLTDFDPGPGTVNRTPVGSYDGFLLKLSGATGTF